MFEGALGSSGDPSPAGREALPATPAPSPPPHTHGAYLLSQLPWQVQAGGAAPSSGAGHPVSPRWHRGTPRRGRRRRCTRGSREPALAPRRLPPGRRRSKIRPRPRHGPGTQGRGKKNEKQTKGTKKHESEKTQQKQDQATRKIASTAAGSQAFALLLLGGSPRLPAATLVVSAQAPPLVGVARAPVAWCPGKPGRAPRRWGPREGTWGCQGCA